MKCRAHRFYAVPSLGALEVEYKDSVNLVDSDRKAHGAVSEIRRKSHSVVTRSTLQTDTLTPSCQEEAATLSKKNVDSGRKGQRGEVTGP